MIQAAKSACLMEDPQDFLLKYRRAVKTRLKGARQLILSGLRELAKQAGHLSPPFLPDWDRAALGSLHSERNSQPGQWIP